MRITINVDKEVVVSETEEKLFWRPKSGRKWREVVGSVVLRGKVQIKEGENIHELDADSFTTANQNFGFVTGL